MSPADQHLLLLSDAEEGHMNGPSLAALAAAGLSHCFDFSNQINQKFEDLHVPANNATVETQECQLRNFLQSTTLEVLSSTRRQHQDWFDDNDAEISNLLTEKNGLHKAYMDLLTDATTRWAEHFRSVLNCSPDIFDAAIDRLPQTDTHNDLELPPSLAETIRAVQNISSGNEPEADAIPSEVYKHDLALVDGRTHNTLIGDLAPRTMTDGVKQGCLLAPTLFSIIFSAVLMDAHGDEDPGIRIAYRTDWHLLNSRRMESKMHVPMSTVHDLLFADDCVLNSVTEENTQRSMDLFVAGWVNFRVIISTAKNGGHALTAA
ncbi:unnamed protein product [Schistocephalus solidus]|uniref:Reverse transcriptase domain-containing protein n=1 Tax=Schistocephalus solidus TaxID=70667 RepID=A0A3P7F4Z1_SCHSO|nr:unnamed protein product [Schistocephalus solidus]